MIITQEYLEEQGYAGVRQCQNGVWIGISAQIYTFGLCVGLDEFGYRVRYCYENWMDVWYANRSYSGEGDPSGPWIKRKGPDGEKLGPGAKGEGSSYV